MKASLISNLPGILILGLLLTYCSSPKEQTAQGPPAWKVGKKAGPTIITLVVDTENINQTNVMEEVALVDNWGNTSAGLTSIAEFTSPIYASRYVIWNAIPENLSVNDTARVQKVWWKETKSGPKNKDLINFKNNAGIEGDGIVVGKVRKKIKVDDIEEYAIKFTVNSVEYTLDPKLKVPPGGDQPFVPPGQEDEAELDSTRNDNQ